VVNFVSDPNVRPSRLSLLMIDLRIPFFFFFPHHDTFLSRSGYRPPPGTTGVRYHTQHNFLSSKIYLNAKHRL